MEISVTRSKNAQICTKKLDNLERVKFSYGIFHLNSINPIKYDKEIKRIKIEKIRWSPMGLIVHSRSFTILMQKLHLQLSTPDEIIQRIDFVVYSFFTLLLSSHDIFDQLK